MKRRDLLGLFLLGLAVRLVTAALIPRPGYMDAAYYAAGGVRLAQGGGLSEPFLWHYLDDPAGLPHPGFLYWMPFPSLLAAPFAALFPDSFLSLQLPFAALSALLPLITYTLAWRATERRRTAWAAGLLTLFSGFFFPYWTLPETFTPFALVGSLALWLAGTGRKRGTSLAVGLLVGLAHLTRADGVLLLPIAGLAPLLSPRERRRPILSHWALILLGYLLVMGPWFGRNLSLIGAPLSPAGTRTLWLRSYDDLFCYRCDLSLQSYLAWGGEEIIRSKLWAAGVNLQRFLAEDCLIFLLPFTLLGLYRLRRRSPFLLATLYLLLTYLVHSFAFTFPGPRGGFFHTSTALLPFLFVAGMEGVEAVVDWAARQRRWNRRQAGRVFATAAVTAAVLLSIYALVSKLPAWRTVDAAYVRADGWLEQQGVVMVGNPPAFWYHTGRPAVVVPNGDVETLLAVADQYGVVYVLLDRNLPAALRDLYRGEETHPRLRPLVTRWEEENRAILYAVER